MNQPPAPSQSILLIRLQGLLARCRFRRSQVRLGCYLVSTSKCCTQLMLECPGSLCLNTWTKTDTCRRATSELAKPPVQAAGRFQSAEVERNQECADNLLRRRGGRSRLLCNRARTDWGLRDSRHRMRASPQGPACHILACL